MDMMQKEVIRSYSQINQVERRENRGGTCIRWDLWCGVRLEEEREEGTMHVKREKREEDHVVAFCWSSGCPDSGIAPPCLSPDHAEYYGGVNGCPDHFVD